MSNQTQLALCKTLFLKRDLFKASLSPSSNWYEIILQIFLPKIIEKKTFNSFMDHFSWQYKGFLLYGFSPDLI